MIGNVVVGISFPVSTWRRPCAQVWPPPYPTPGDSRSGDFVLWIYFGVKEMSDELNVSPFLIITRDLVGLASGDCNGGNRQVDVYGRSADMLSSASAI